MSDRERGADGEPHGQTARLLRVGAPELIQSPSSSVRGAVLAEALRSSTRRPSSSWSRLWEGAWGSRIAAAGVAFGVFIAAAGAWWVVRAGGAGEAGGSSSIALGSVEAEGGAGSPMRVPSPGRLVRSIESAVRVEFVRRVPIEPDPAPISEAEYGLLADPVAREARLLSQQTRRVGKSMFSPLPFSSLMERAAAMDNQQ